MSRSMTLAIERIADDAEFAERFRTDPDRALRRYRLSDSEIVAVKRGDHASLVDCGVDVVAFADGKRHGVHRFWRQLLVACTVAGAVIGLAASPAAAEDNKLTGVRKASARQARLGRAIRVGRVLVTRSSVRFGLRRNGIRVRASGRANLRAGIRQYCDAFPKGSCVIKGDFDPIVLAD